MGISAAKISTIYNTGRFRIINGPPLCIMTIQPAICISLQQSFIHLDDTSWFYPEISVLWQHTSISCNMLSTVQITKYIFVFMWPKYHMTALKYAHEYFRVRFQVNTILACSIQPLDHVAKSRVYLAIVWGQVTSVAVKVQFPVPVYHEFFDWN